MRANSPPRGKQYVGLLEVAVHDARAADDLEGLGDPGDEYQDGPDREAPVPGDRRRGLPVGIAVDDRGDVQALYPLGGLDVASGIADGTRGLPRPGRITLMATARPSRRVGQVSMGRVPPRRGRAPGLAAGHPLPSAAVSGPTDDTPTGTGDSSRLSMHRRMVGVVRTLGEPLLRAPSGQERDFSAREYMAEMHSVICHTKTSRWARSDSCVRFIEHAVVGHDHFN